MIDAAFLAVDDNDSGMLSANEIEHVFFGGIDHRLLSLEHAGTHSSRRASHVPPAGLPKTKSRRVPTELDWINKDLDDRIMQLCSDFVPALSLQVHLSQYHRKRYTCSRRCRQRGSGSCLPSSATTICASKTFELFCSAMLHKRLYAH